ncbi:MAG TPA: four helix bundle protein [Kofleriaceae bacterium]|nr:four helix bundle protein [Kofleriaceae bacterium]
MPTFVAYEVAVELVRELRPMVELIAQHDANLADQMKRAATSVVLNLSEGARRAAGNRRRAYEIAHGEARELLGALDCAAAWGYVLDASRARATLDRLLGLLWGLTHPGHVTRSALRGQTSP